jgi:hypothetical protein
VILRLEVVSRGDYLGTPFEGADRWGRLFDGSTQEETLIGCLPMGSDLDPTSGLLARIGELDMVPTPSDIVL